MRIMLHFEQIMRPVTFMLIKISKHILQEK